MTKYDKYKDVLTEGCTIKLVNGFAEQYCWTVPEGGWKLGKVLFTNLINSDDYTAYQYELIDHGCVGAQHITHVNGFPIDEFLAISTGQPALPLPIVEGVSALDVQVGGGHYKGLVIQPAEYIHKNNLNYFQGNVIKYVTRYKDKNGVEDLCKAIHYLQLLKEMEYPDAS